ncbi:hypothetical protein KJ611_01980 [Patescibacteria group bacterium]|nr:hypothetical protein [Patescibacteria group bacterium]MBU1705450.1 hypothetical protein [Patescibacteria group bacterium]
MIKVISKLQSSIFTLIFLALLVANVYLWQIAWLGVILLIWYAIYFGAQLGRALAPDEHPFLQWWLGGFWLISGLMLAGSGIYYLAEISQLTSMVTALLSVPVVLWLGGRSQTSFWHRFHNLWQAKAHRIPSSTWLATVVIIFCLYLGFYLAAAGQVTEAVRTTWINLPTAFFVAFGLAGLMLGAQLWRGQERAINIALVMALLFLAVSVAAFVYPLGFGFDSFIHQITEEYIAAFGSVSPKPLYYIGQYSLVLFSHQVFGLPVAQIDTWLLPILTAALLPAAWYGAAAHLLRDRRAATATLLGIFLMPLSALIVTTPQGLANLWILLTVLAAVPYLVNQEKPRVFWLLIPALATLATHPIAGLPILLFVVLIAAEPAKTHPKLQAWAKILFWLILILGSVVLPASFVANSLRTAGTWGLDLSALNFNSLAAALHWDLFLENRFEPWLDFAYLYGYNLAAIIGLVAILAWWRRRGAEGKSLRVLLAMAVILLINYVFLMTVVDFSFLIDYERQNYAARLIPIMTFFLIPLFILGLGLMMKALQTKPVVLRVGVIVLLALLATASLYVAYPRDDAYERGHGFNVAQSDINAVYAIDREAAGQPYAVLANQSVSAAAIRYLGFEHYYGELYFYPIPTGGELYQFFLEMNVKPDKKIAQGALDLIAERCGNCARPKILFYVVNDYWWQAPRLIETGKSTADAWFSLDQGRIHVFRYQAAE